MINNALEGSPIINDTLVDVSFGLGRLESGVCAALKKARFCLARVEWPCDQSNSLPPHAWTSQKRLLAA
ncbi:MAG TPA: hypothetical protein VGP06_17620 [Janthinobacterium sp.]|nr:hypothetical protein [Janthinobacterium sp.]